MRETSMISKISGVLMVLLLFGFVLGCGSTGGSSGGVFSIGGKIIGPGGSGVELVLSGVKSAVAKTDKDGAFLFGNLDSGIYNVKAGALTVDAKDVSIYKIDSAARVVTIEGKSISDVIFYVEYKSSSSPVIPNPTQEAAPAPNPSNEATPMPNPTKEAIPTPNPTKEAAQDPKPIEPSVKPISYYAINGFIGGNLSGVTVKLYSYSLKEEFAMDTANTENKIISPNEIIISNPIDKPIKTIITSEDGCFYFEGLPAGKYVVKAEKSGYSFQPKYYEITLPGDERSIDFEPVEESAISNPTPVKPTDKILLEENRPGGIQPIYTPAIDPVNLSPYDKLVN